FARDITERKTSEQEIRKLNEDLCHRALLLQAANSELQAEVSTRQRAEEALQESNAALEAFSYTISHDLRAPLRAMQGIAQALVEDYGDRLDATGLDYARRVVGSAQQMDTLIQDLLAYSRLGRADLPTQPVNLQAVVAEALGRVS